MNTQANRPDDYQVIVSNIGTVYSGNMASEARGEYEDYKHRSKEALGRAAGEDVTLMFQGEPCEEFIGAISDARAQTEQDNAEGEDEGCGVCPACIIKKLLKQAQAKANEPRAAQYPTHAQGYTVFRKAEEAYAYAAGFIAAAEERPGRTTYKGVDITHGKTVTDIASTATGAVWFSLVLEDNELRLYAQA